MAAAFAALPAQAAQGTDAEATAAQGEGEAPVQMVAVVHAHSHASTGGWPVARLATAARETGVDVVFLTENFGYEFRYAPWPIRYFFEASQSTPGVEDFGLDRWLWEVDEVQRRESAPIFFVGVEVPVYYYWTGSLLGADLMLHDMQRNMLVFAPPAGAEGDEVVLATSEVRGFFEGLPVIGNRARRAAGPGSLLLLAPGLITVAWSLRRLWAAGLLSSARGTHYRLDDVAGKYVRVRPAHHKPATWAYLAVCAAGVALLWLNFPYTVASVAPYDSGTGYAPFQRLIDRVAEEKGLSFWSMPEATDYHERSVGPFSVKLETDPYPDAIVETAGFTGFGGVYADTITTTEPGGSWDEAIGAYLAGERTSPPWVIGESAFHWPGQAGKQFDDVLTVLLVPAPGRAAAFEALARGRSYAVRKDQGPSLRLSEFALATVGGGAVVARAGETLRVGAGADLELRLRVDEAAGTPLPVEIEVIRHGALYRRHTSTTPLEIAWLETLEPGAPASWYRVVVRGPGAAHLVSNPIFVRRDR